MTATLIDGKAIAEHLREAIAREVKRTETAHGFVPGLAVVLVGDNPASQVYVRSKGEHSKAAGEALVGYLYDKYDGDPQKVAASKKSRTAAFLARALSR